MLHIKGREARREPNIKAREARRKPCIKAREARREPRIKEGEARRMPRIKARKEPRINRVHFGLSSDGVGLVLVGFGLDLNRVWVVFGLVRVGFELGWV